MNDHLLEPGHAPCSMRATESHDTSRESAELLALSQALLA
jgi:hypothetical protein